MGKLFATYASGLLPFRLPPRLTRIWHKVVLPLLAAAGVVAVFLAALWLAESALAWALPITLATAVLAIARLWQVRPRARVAVYWGRGGRRGGPYVLEAEYGREATSRDYASWSAIMIGVAGLLANGFLTVFGLPGVPFPTNGFSLASFFALLCIGLYGRP